MANRWKGNFIVATEATSSGTAYTGKANGSWSLNNQIQQKQANLWAKGIGAPTAPTIGTATAGNANASVAFTASSEAGAPGSLTYTATSTPGSFTNTGSSSPIVVSGLTNGTQYTFKVNATNALGYVSPDSAASNSTGTTVPGAPTIGTATALDSSASITFTLSANTGGLPITGYTATSSPGSITGTAASSPVTVSGLTNGTSYTFTVVATNAIGNSLPSAASNSVTPAGNSILLSHAGSPYISAYTWANGLGAKYANPASLPPTSTSGLSLNSVGNTVAVSHNLSPFISVYPWDSGFGTKYSAPSTLPDSRAWSISFSPDGNYLVEGNNTAPWVVAYNWSSGFGSKLADPSTNPGSASEGICFSKSGSVVVTVNDLSPYVSAYNWSAGFGTKKANPSTLPPSLGFSCDFSHNDTYLAISLASSPYVAVYNWSSGFGSKIADPSTSIGAQSQSVRFSNNSTYIAINSTVSPYANVFAFSSSGFGTKAANPAVLPAGAARGGLMFKYTPDILAVGHDNTPYVSIYPFTTSFGAKYADPITPLPGTVSGIAYK